MRIAITGTYSSGKTLTSLALSHYLNLPRVQARMTRQIMPEAMPGKALRDCSPSEIIQLIVARHMERVVHEHDLQEGFISDGCSLQEWIYGAVRVRYGADPNQSNHLTEEESIAKTAELSFFESVIEQLGKLFKRHVEKSFDIFVHLTNELPLDKDGHRPVNESFRKNSDKLLVSTLNQISIPHHTVRGSLEERLQEASRIVGIKPAISLSNAISTASLEYSQIKESLMGVVA